MISPVKAKVKQQELATSGNVTAVTAYAKGKDRNAALIYFASLLVFWNILGYAFLGFEQAWVQPVIAVFAACITQLLLEFIDANREKRALRYQSSLTDAVIFFLPALISGLAVGMLLYVNQSFAGRVCIGVGNFLQGFISRTSCRRHATYI